MSASRQADIQTQDFPRARGELPREWETALTAHSDEQLAAIQANGFDADWLRGRLYFLT